MTIKKDLTRSRAIREKCIDCMGGQRQEVRLCIDYECPLWPFRLGHKEKNQADAEDCQQEESGNDNVTDTKIL